MNAEERKELERRIAVMQAYLDGKKIEARQLTPIGPWISLSHSLRWQWDFCDYRIKREPREWKGLIGMDGGLYHYIEGDELRGCEVIHVREVLPE